MPQGTASFPLFGGLDLVSSALTIPPGRVIAGLNYEPTSQGYSRLRGYERFDGHPAPSAATYWRLDYTGGGAGGATAPVSGDDLFRGSVVAQCVCVATVTTSGTWAGANAAGYFIVTSNTGNMVGTVKLTAGATPIIATVTVQTLEYNFGAATNAIYTAASIAAARAEISAVTGSGPIRGVWYTASGEIIAMRDNAGATAGVMWKATTSGWSAVAVLSRIDFTIDTATQTLPTNVLVKIAAGVANASASSSDGTIRFVAITEPAIAPATVSTGYFLVSGLVAAQFTAGGQTIYLAGTSTQLGTTTAAATSPTIPAGGRYFFINHNFYGAEDRAATYMVNGVGKALVYDGHGFGEISTGMTVDTPERIAAHRGSLFLSFPGGSLQFSQVGEPLVFDAVLGAGEIGVGSDITDLIPANKTTLAILAEDSISVLYGNDSTDYLLETLTDEAGAHSYTAQRMAQVIYMDSGGIRTLSSSAAYGNYSFGSLSLLIAPLLTANIRNGVLPILSFKIRRKNQYWLIFSDGTGLVAHLGRKNPEWLPFTLDIDAYCACSVEVADVERIFIGDDSAGYVYEFDKGTSFDGTNIDHYVQLPPNHLGSPRNDKRVFEFAVSMETDGDPTLTCELILNDGVDQSLAAQAFEFTTGSTMSEGIIEGGVVARNFSARIAGQTDDEEPHTLVDATYYVAPRRLKRG